MSQLHVIIQISIKNRVVVNETTTLFLNSYKYKQTISFACLDKVMNYSKSTSSKDSLVEGCGT